MNDFLKACIDNKKQIVSKMKKCQKKRSLNCCPNCGNDFDCLNPVIETTLTELIRLLKAEELRNEK